MDSLYNSVLTKNLSFYVILTKCRKFRSILYYIYFFNKLVLFSNIYTEICIPLCTFANQKVTNYFFLNKLLWFQSPEPGSVESGVCIPWCVLFFHICILTSCTFFFATSMVYAASYTMNNVLTWIICENLFAFGLRQIWTWIFLSLKKKNIYMYI